MASTRDRIAVTGIRVRAHHGVFDFEREQGQEFVIDVSVAVDLAAAACGDDLASTVHYGELAVAVAQAVERDRSTTARRMSWTSKLRAKP